MKGQVLVNCGTMGLDPAALSLSGYLEALDAHNSAADGPGAQPPSEALGKFMAAHGVAGHA